MARDNIAKSDALLIKLFNANTPIVEMAKQLDCTREQLYKRISQLGLSVRERNKKGFIKQIEPNHINKVKRPCLKCKEDFLSDHKGHRICNGCSYTNAGYVGVVYG